MSNRANYVTLGTLNLGASASNTFTLDINDAFSNCQLVFEYTYATTGTTSGLTVNVKNGVGDRDVSGRTYFPASNQTATLHLDSVGTTYTMNPVTTSAGSPQTVVTFLPIASTLLGNWMQVTVTNKDASTMTLKIYAYL